MEIEEGRPRRKLIPMPLPCEFRGLEHSFAEGTERGYMY